MATKNALRDVDPYAITICKQGANRKRIFLKKEAATPDVELPGAGAIIRKADGDSWSVFYCVVAEPGAEEDPGLVGEPGSVDVWESEEEIRKAAHRLLKNGAYVNAMHDAMAEEGCAIVENAVALTDIEIVDPTGVAQVIRKGSWYVAIEPSDTFRAAVDAGQVTGVSMEGTGVRVALEKASKHPPLPTKPGGPDNWVEKAGGLPKYIDDVARAIYWGTGAGAGDVSRAISIAVGRVRDWAEGKGGVNADTRAKAAKAIAEWDRKRASAKVKKSDSLADMEDDDRGLLRKIAEKLGLVQKASDPPTFSRIMAQRELDDELPDAFSALRSAIYYAFAPSMDGTEPADPAALVRTSLDEFGEWAIGLLARLTPQERTAVAKQLGTVESSIEEDPGDMETNAERITKLEKALDPEDPTSAVGALKKAADENSTAVQGLIGLVEKLVERSDSKSKEDDEGKGDVKKESKPIGEQIGELADALDGFDARLTEIAKSVAAVAEGDSAQQREGDTAVKKSDNPLAGLLA